MVTAIAQATALVFNVKDGGITPGRGGRTAADGNAVSNSNKTTKALKTFRVDIVSRVFNQK